MKKLLVVMLVLAMASMANAAIVMTTTLGTDVDEGASMSFDVTAPTETELGDYYLAILSTSTGTASFDLTNVVIVYTGTSTNISTGDDADTMTGLGTSVAYVAMGVADNEGDVDPVIGDIFTDLQLIGGTAGSVTVRLFDPSWENWNDYTVTVNSIVPEPITIGLLGLGAMFLRRRK